MKPLQRDYLAGYSVGRRMQNDTKTADAIDAAIKRIERLEGALHAVVSNLDYLRNQWGDEGITRTVRDKVQAALEGRD
jgi:hypothetical protein